MISQLFDNATKKAGNQTALAEILGLTQQRLSAFKTTKQGIKESPMMKQSLGLRSIWD